MSVLDQGIDLLSKEEASQPHSALDVAETLLEQEELQPVQTNPFPFISTAIKPDATQYQSWRQVTDTPLVMPDMEPGALRRQAEEILKISDDLVMPLSVTMEHYDALVADPKDIPRLQPPPADEIPTIGPHEPTAWQQFKNFFVSDWDNLPPNPDRIEVIHRAMQETAGAPLHIGLKAFNALLLGPADLAWATIKRSTPKEEWDTEYMNLTLSDALDKAMGYHPSGFIKATGDLADLLGRMKTIRGLLDPYRIFRRAHTIMNQVHEGAVLFGLATASEEIGKELNTAIDPTETDYGYEGSTAVLRDTIMGGILGGTLGYGMEALWGAMNPSEYRMALALLGLKEGATKQEINRAAARMSKQYKPSQIKKMTDNFLAFTRARETLMAGEEKKIVVRGQSVTVKGKAEPPELAEAGPPATEATAEATRAAIKPKAVPGTVETTPEIVPPGAIERPSEAKIAIMAEQRAGTTTPREPTGEAAPAPSTPPPSPQGKGQAPSAPGARTEPLSIQDQFKARLENPFARHDALGAVNVEPLQELVSAGDQKLEIAGQWVNEVLDALRFYPNAPAPMRNDVRTDLIGGNSQDAQWVEKDLRGFILGGLKKADVEQARKIIWTRDALSRQKRGIGNPTKTADEVQLELDRLETEATAPALQAADQATLIHGIAEKRLIDLKLLDPDKLIPGHLRHYVVQYTPEFAPTAGIPTRLRTPRRGYLRRATENDAAYRQTWDAYFQSIREILYDNRIESFIKRQAAKYDRLAGMTSEEKAAAFGTDALGRSLRPNPGHRYTVGDQVYWGYSPDAPFSRTIYLSEEGQPTLGQHKNVSLLPEDVYQVFQSFSAKGEGGLAGRFVYLTNVGTRWWKSLAIYSRLPGFTINNLLGDTAVALLQHPKPWQLLKGYQATIQHMRGQGDPKFAAWLIDNDIETGLLRGEIWNHHKGHLGKLLKYINIAEDARENFNRDAYAWTLWDSMRSRGPIKPGDPIPGADMVKAHDWIDTKGLSISDALGKIAREVETDYQAKSKEWRRYISGAAAPFGTWYLDTTARLARWGYHHPIKALIAAESLPVASNLWNYRNDESAEIERNHPDYIRNRVHFNFGKLPNGKALTWCPQWLGDALIGTKVFSIATDYAGRAARGEMTPKDAATETLSHWGVAEARGATLLLNPMVRFVNGLIARRDPYDGAPIYSSEPDKLTALRKYEQDFMFLMKTFVPPLGTFVQSQEKGLPLDVATQKLYESWAGKGVFGFYEVGPKGELLVDINGRKVKLDSDNMAEMKDWGREEYVWFDDVQMAFVDEGVRPEDFINTPRYMDLLVKLYDTKAKTDTSLVETESGPAKAAKIEETLGPNRIAANLLEPSVLSRWKTTQLARANTEDEQRRIAEQMKSFNTLSLMEAFKRQPISVRGPYIQELLKKEQKK